MRLQTFKFFTVLRTATSSFTSKFGSALSSYKIQRLGVLEERGDTEDGRTEDLTLEYDSESADETWEEFLKRLDVVEKDWQTDLD